MSHRFKSMMSKKNSTNKQDKIIENLDYCALVSLPIEVSKKLLIVPSEVLLKGLSLSFLATELIISLIIDDLLKFSR